MSTGTRITVKPKINVSTQQHFLLPITNTQHASTLSQLTA